MHLARSHIHDPLVLAGSLTDRPSIDQLFQPGLGAIVRTDDFDVMADCAPGWSQEYEQLGQGRFGGSLSFAQSAGIQLGVAEWSPGIVIRGSAPARSAVVAVPLRAPGIGIERGAAMRKGEAVVLGPGEEVDFRASGPFRLFVASIAPELLEEHAQRMIGRSFRKLVRRGRIATTAGQGRVHAALERLGLPQLFEDPGCLCDPKVARWAECRVLDVVLDGARMPVTNGAVPGSALIARRAEEYLRAHLSEPVTVLDLCAAVGVPERTLHLAFERHVGTSPKAFMKGVRLHAVRHELRRAPAGVSVTRIAMQWGFFHPGWFSHDYHRMFGCTPSETRRRALERLAATG